MVGALARRRARTGGMPRPARSLALALVVAPVLAPTRARADEFSLHALLTSQSAVTTNAFSLPDGGTSSIDPSLNYQIRPGVLLSYHTRRALHELSADAGLDGNDLSSNVTLTFRGGWRATYAVSPRSELEGGAAVSGGRVNALSTSSPANMGGPGVIPTGQVDFYSADANQSISYELTPLWNARQSAFARYLVTDADAVDTTGLELGVGLSADRVFKLTAIGFQAQGSFQRLGTQPMGAPIDNRDQVDVRGTVRLRRDLSEKWSAALEAGVVSLVPLEAGDKLFYQPIVAADLAYFPVWGSAGLALRHAVAPNLFLAQNEVTDSAVINAALPLPFIAGSRFDPKLTFLTSLGLAHTRFIDLTDGSNRAAFNVFYTDAALQYSPQPNLQLAVRYQFVKQSDADTTNPDPTLAMLGYVRHTVMVSFAGRWPARLAAEMPVRSGIRVRDLTPVGNATGAVSGGGRGGGGDE